MSTFDIDKFISNNPNILESLYNDESSIITKQQFDDLPRNDNYIKYQAEKKELEKKELEKKFLEELEELAKKELEKKE